MSRYDFRRRIDALKQSISLRQLIENDGHKVVRSGGLDKCCCPFHREKTPSCVIYPDQHFHCFGCHSRGDVFSYVMLRDGCDFRTAVEKLDGVPTARADRGYQKVIQRPKDLELNPDHLTDLLFKWQNDTQPIAISSLARTLSVSVESIEHLEWNWAKEHRAWSIPMFDGDGRILGFRFRSETGEKWALKGSKQGLFIPFKTPQKDLYVTEGPTDCAAMLSMGLFAIGKASAMQGPEEIVKFIAKNRIRRVIVIADNDTAGLNGAKKLIDVCPVPCCELVLPAKDAREFYRNGGTRELIENLLKSAVWRNPKP